MAKIPLGDTINYGYSFTFGNLITIAGLTWLPLGLAAVAGYFLQDYVWSFIPKLFAVQGNATAAMTLLSDLAGFYALLLAAIIATMFFYAVAAVAVTNHALGLRTGPVYIHFAAGGPEWRVFGGFIRYFFAAIGVYLIFGLGCVVAVLLGTMVNGADNSAPWIWIIVVLGVIALICLAVLTIVRMGYLIVPSIVMEPGKGGLARSYHLTRGNFWRIFIVVLVMVLPVAMVQGAVQSAFMGNAMATYFTEIFGSMRSGSVPDPTAMNAAMVHYLEAIHAVLLPMSIIGWIASILTTGLLYSSTAYAYRALAGAPGVGRASATGPA